MRHLLPLTVLLLSCSGGDEDSDALSLGDPAVELSVPSLDDIDFPAAFGDAIEAALQTDMRTAWAGHVSTLNHAVAGCPDWYAGNPDVEDGNIDLDEDATGTSWMDFCTTTAGENYGGFAYWETNIAIDGEIDTLEGRTSTASRRLVGDGVLADGDRLLYEFDGEGSDSLTLIEGEGFYRYTYSSFVDATVGGDLAFDLSTTTTPGGYRTDMYLFYTGGDADTLEARGNIYYPERRLHERFDSIAMDIEFRGPEGAGPDDCTKEPRGWVAIRDDDAFWYDLVFEPRYEDDPTDTGYNNDPYTSCDGCGTLYVRGIEMEGVEVCLDLSFIWSGTLSPPSVEEFVLNLRDVEGT